MRLCIDLWTLCGRISAWILPSLECRRIIAIYGIVIWFFSGAFSPWQFSSVNILVETTGTIIIIKCSMSNLSRGLHWLYTLYQFLRIFKLLIFHNSTASGTRSNSWEGSTPYVFDNWLVFVSAWSLLSLRFVSIHLN